MPQDVLLDIVPEKSGRGRRLLRFNIPQKDPNEYSTTKWAIRSRQKRAEMPLMETLLMLHERADVRALRRVMKVIASDPRTRWDEMSEAEQEELREQKRQEILEQRDRCGRSATAFSNRILKLATSCIGDAAMLQFLMQSRKARSKVMSLFEGLVSLEEDGKLRLLAGARGDQSDEEEKETGSTTTDEGGEEEETASEHEDVPSTIVCQWQGCGRSFDASAALYLAS
ncbi:hypothetical protein A1O7_02467 [Cladophialophora yegresii CBS 114405]|uniref:Uncharacterized protein n=1 Tax=Cladophialophora yegresii CBS 114405 TaxID=1182544 RepID=W9WUP6_9EURO|nr:uncharacterized protein A1O7_02467 [Cladophialophora yegresii CBS 114405]EXJ62034.1 hypothetical protein A1O7_02467 [Cladophialophora yegresii CBS 114405]